jgi:molybdopterin-containing oxidoreductase family membrane subunit
MTTLPTTQPANPPDEPPILAPGYTLDSITDKISSMVLKPGLGRWVIGFGVAFALVMLFLYAVANLLVRGIGIWGVNNPVGWGIYIVNFVWWIGIARRDVDFRLLAADAPGMAPRSTALPRAMTLFAVACAALFPLMHLGRPEYFYFLLPYPASSGLWPQFRSPIVWDFFAITTYGLVSFQFWFVGLLPDLATLRDRAKRKWVKVIFGFLAMGWRGSARHWFRYQKAYFLLAALATPLVVSVHSIVSLDFASGIIPGWHSTIFPPYFVAGAIFSGMAMVLTIAIPLRSAYGLQGMITRRHLDNMAKIMLASGLVVAYGYLMEFFNAWYSGNIYEMHAAVNRALGYYAPLFWLMMACNVLLPQLLWFRWVRNAPLLLFVMALLINVGMWTERFVIVVTSLHNDFLPSAWGNYLPTVWDIATLLGTIGLFAALLFLFVRFLPAISMFEVRKLLTDSRKEQSTP